MKRKKLKAMVALAVTTSMALQFGVVEAFASTDNASINFEMYNQDKSETSSSISTKYKLTNNGNSDLDLSTVTIRYYFTIDNEKDQSYWCDYASKQDSNGYVGITNGVKGKFVKMDTPMEGADHYLEISFTKDAGNLAAGGFIELQNRFAKSDWSSYTQSNDYSFNSSNSNYGNWDNVVVLVDGEVVSGQEPDKKVDIVETNSVKVELQNGTTDIKTATISPKFTVTNTGNTSLDLSELKLRYFYTSDDDKAQNFFCDYSAITNGSYRGLTDKVVGTIEKLDEAKDNSDTYLEIGFKSDAGKLAPGETMVVQTRISKEDWSNYDQSNDFSLNNSENVTLNYEGEDIWGNAPGKIVHNSKLSIEELDYNKKYPEDKEVGLSLKGNEFTGIVNGDAPLVEGTDYRVDGEKVILTKEYLSSLPEGKVNLTFNFSAGKAQVLKVNVTDKSSMDITIGDAEGKAGETIKMPVTIKGVTEKGVYGYNFVFKYDKNKFENVSIEAGENAVNPNATFYAGVNSEKGYISATYLDSAADGSESIYSDGVICYITMTIKKDVSAGTSKISLLDPGDFIDTDFKVYKTNYNSGTITIKETKNSSIKPSVINVDLADVKDETINMTLNDNKLVSITNGSESLVEGKDYSVEESKVILSKDYLSTLPQGKTELTFNFSAGKSQVLKVNVTKTITKPNLDITIGSMDAVQGKTIKVPVTVKGVTDKGIYGYNFVFKYDTDKFEDVSIEAGENAVNPNATFYAGVNSEKGYISATYLDSAADGSESIYSDGVICYITMKVKADAKVGETTISLEDAGDFIDVDFTQYKTNYIEGKINISKDIEVVTNNSKIDKDSISFEEGKANDTDIKIDYKGNELTSIVNNGTELVKNEDYKVTNEGIVLKAEYLNKLSSGDYNLVFNFSAGESQTLKVNVTKEVSEEAKIYIDNVEAAPGETVKVAIRIKDIPTPVGCSAVILNYDPSQVEVESVEAGSSMVNPKDNFLGSISKKNNVIYLYFIDSEATGKELMKDDGVYAYVTFKVLDTVKSGTVISIDSKDPSNNVLADFDTNDIPFTFTAGSITVK